jgi:hypothetical protein
MKGIVMPLIERFFNHTISAMIPATKIDNSSNMEFCSAPRNEPAAAKHFTSPAAIARQRYNKSVNPNPINNPYNENCIPVHCL